MSAPTPVDGRKRRRHQPSRGFSAAVDALAAPIATGAHPRRGSDVDDDEQARPTGLSPTVDATSMDPSGSTEPLASVRTEAEADPGKGDGRFARTLRSQSLASTTSDPLKKRRRRFIEPGRRTAPDEPNATTTGPRPISNRRALVLALCGLTALTEAASVAKLLPDLPVADLDISIALLPALVLAVACGPRLLGRSTARPFAAAFWVFGLIALPVLGFEFWRIGRLDWYPGLIAAALGEELVYRLAIPAVIAVALRLGHVRPDLARIAGLAGAGIWFVLLPGHQEQMGSVAGAAPFVAFAALAAFIVYRSGSILPMAVAHACSNLLTVLMWQNAIGSSARSAALASVLLLLVIAYGRPSRLTLGDEGELVDTRTGMAVTAIDLRDGRPVTVALSDGTVLKAPRHRILAPKREAVTVTDPDAPAPDEVPADLVALSERARFTNRTGKVAATPGTDPATAPRPLNLPKINP